mmetsp:Transcript_3144/g.8967  ORF Transcript_3144/g.8967 Transcript_3144/m.8967 type:complete len:187 (+) Transcript_3144:3743-4303(+)
MSESKGVEPLPSPEIKPGGTLATPDSLAGGAVAAGEAFPVEEPLGEGEEEVFASNVGSADEVEFDGMVGLLEEVLISDAFQDTQERFCTEHCGVFDDSEELKLEYTELHRQYMDLMEGFIAKECESRRPEWSMERIMKVLSSGNPEEMTGDVFDLLMSLSDIQEFQQLMLSYKHAGDGTGPDLFIG